MEAQDFATAAAAQRRGADDAAALDAALPALLAELRTLYTRNTDLFMRM